MYGFPLVPGETKAPRNKTGDSVSCFAASLAGLFRMKAVPKIAKDSANEVTLMNRLNATEKRVYDLLQIRLK